MEEVTLVCLRGEDNLCLQEAHRQRRGDIDAIIARHVLSWLDQQNKHIIIMKRTSREHEQSIGLWR